MSTIPAKPSAQKDPVVVDPKHYKVEIENDQVRVLRVTYGLNEKSVMHSHPAGVLVCLKDFHTRFTLADGKTEERHGSKGQVLYLPAEEHVPENIGSEPIELLLIELKR
jgi:hypothetical protein